MMTADAYVVYRMDKEKRKEDIVERLRGQLQYELNSADALDKKAQSLFSVSSAIFAVVASLQFAVNRPQFEAWQLIFLAVVLIFYLWHMYEIVQAIKPMKWLIGIAGDKGDVEFETIMEKYVPIEDDEYFETLIVDYGAGIEIARINNYDKVEHIAQAVRAFMLVVVGLVVMAIAIGL